MSDEQDDNRLSYPHLSGDFLILGPEIFTDKDEKVISWQGSNYYRACDAFVRKRPEGGASYCIRQMGHEDNNHIDFSGHCTRELTYIGGDVTTTEGDVVAPSVPTDGYSQDIETELEPNGEVMVTLNVACMSKSEVDETMDVLLSPLLTLAKKEGGYVALSLDGRDY